MGTSSAFDQVKGVHEMFGRLARGVGAAQDAVLMAAVHVGRIAGVVTTAAGGLAHEVVELVWDWRDVARTGLSPEPEDFDLSRDVGPVGLERRDHGNQPPRRVR